MKAKADVMPVTPPFAPVVVTLTLESQAEVDAFRALVITNTSVPEIVARHYPSFATHKGVFDILKNIQHALDAAQVNFNR